MVRSDADTLFRAAIRNHVTNDDLLYKYALFLARSKGINDPDVKTYFDRAICEGPCNCFALANYAWWLLSRASYLDAVEIVNQALKYVYDDMRQLKVELLLYRSLINCVRQQDDTGHFLCIYT